MAFSYGFYNSLNGDRRYKAEQFGDLIGSLITDGVFENVGNKLFVTVGTGMDINVGTGKAWFDNTWSVNDSIMVLTVPQSDITRPRYDTVVLEVNTDISARENKIKIVSGTPAVTPEKPPLVNTDKIHQHPLAHILVPAAATSITASNITIVVGQADCPFCTGILQKTDITDLYNQWEDDFNSWFENLKAQLTSNVVTNLQMQIDTLSDKIDATEEEIEENANEIATLQTNSGKIMDSNIGKMVQLNSALAGYSLYPYQISVNSSDAYFGYSNIYIDDVSNYIYIVSDNSSYYGIASAKWTPTSSQVLSIVYQKQTSSNYPTIFGLIPAVDNRGFLAYTANQTVVCYDTKTGIASEASNSGVILLTDFRVVYYNYQNSSTNDSLLYISRSSSSSSYNSTTGAPKGTTPPMICGVYGNSFYMVKAMGSGSLGYESYRGYRFDVSSSGANMSSGWFPFPTSQSLSIPFAFFDDTNIYMRVYNNSTQYFGNKIFIYNMVNQTSNYSSIGYTYSESYTSGNECPIGRVEDSDYIYILYVFESSNKCQLLRFSISTGSYAIKDLRIYPSGAYIKDIYPKYERTRYVQTIKKEALYSDGSLPYRGWMVNWDKASITLAVGIDMNNIKMNYAVSGANNVLSYPNVVVNYRDYYAYGGAIHLGPNISSRMLRATCDNADSSQFYIIGKDEVRMYYGAM